MNFEKLDVWKRASALSADVYIQLKNLKDYGFKDQITRSGLSIPSNIAEGMERETDKEVLRFLVIAKSSAAELVTQTYIGMKIDYIPKNIGKQWVAETKQISKMIGAMIKTRRLRMGIKEPEEVYVVE